MTGISGQKLAPAVIAGFLFPSMNTEKPDSAVSRLLEAKNWTFMGCDALDTILDIDKSDRESEQIILDWEIQVEPFLSVSHKTTGAWWIPPKCQYDLREAKRLVWLGIRADLENLVEIVQ
jgi:hypothetical protein